MAERVRSHRDHERGAVLVLATLLLTGLMVMAAIVVDLGHMRHMRGSNQSVADFAALAAGDALADLTGPDGQAACVDAVRYIRLNAEGITDLDLDCEGLPRTCLASTAPVTVSASAEDYEVSITYPVSDAMIADSQVTTGLRHDDGEPCDRLMVNVEQRSSSFFAGVMGRDELVASASAVVRQIPERETRVPSLWLLEPYDCNVLSVQGTNTGVWAGAPDYGGLISLDSDGSGCNNLSSYTIDVGSGVVHAVTIGADPPPQISLYAMEPGQRFCNEGNLNACRQGQVDDGNISPQPTRRTERATRSPIDHRYNCRTDPNAYPAHPGKAYPDYHLLEIEVCPGGSGDYIDQLRAAVRAQDVPDGFNKWSDHFTCGNNPVVPPEGIDGNWVVDCGISLTGSTQVTFNGGNVILNEGITLGGSSRLSFNASNPVANLSEDCLASVTGCLGSSSANAAWVYQRGGNIRMTGGTFDVNGAMVYQHDGDFRMNGGEPQWAGPTEGPFTSLAYWSEKVSANFQISGGAAMELYGIFFTPEANPFAIAGGSPVTPQQAMFVSRSAKISGGARLKLAPLEIQPVVIPPPAPLLIR